jgi:hypothetical protein
MRWWQRGNWWQGGSRWQGGNRNRRVGECVCFSVCAVLICAVLERVVTCGDASCCCGFLIVLQARVARNVPPFGASGSEAVGRDVVGGRGIEPGVDVVSVCFSACAVLSF